MARAGEAFRCEAEQLPYGKEREELLHKARQLETASHVNEWLSSPGLAPSAALLSRENFPESQQVLAAQAPLEVSGTLDSRLRT